MKDALRALALTLLMLFLLITASVMISKVVNAAELRRRVVVIDTGLKPGVLPPKSLCSDGHADFTGMGLADVHGHGTNVAAIIVKGLNPTTHCITIVKFYHNRTASLWPAISYAAALSPAYVNLSVDSGDTSETTEASALAQLLRTGATVVLSAGNEGASLSPCKLYPACYVQHPNLHLVGSIGAFSNYGGPVTDIEDGRKVCAGGYCFTGTSQAAALHTARLLRTCRYPTSPSLPGDQAKTE